MVSFNAIRLKQISIYIENNPVENASAQQLYIKRVIAEITIYDSYSSRVGSILMYTLEQIRDFVLAFYPFDLGRTIR